MSTLKEMAHEYKVAAAKLAMAIERHKKEGNLTPDELNSLRAALRDTRATAHLLSGYYDTPRQDDGLTSCRMMSCAMHQKCYILLTTLVFIGTQLG